jgi:betaine-homocysteine S-methyltransferase
MRALWRPGLRTRVDRITSSARPPYKAPVKAGLLDRLKSGPVICAEGYLFELERRGYLQAGAFVPEAIVENPEVVKRLHEDFVHAGSDVVEAFTYSLVAEGTGFPRACRNLQ